MYAEYFGLNEKPFSIAPDPGYLYMSDRHREALAHLLYGLQTEGGFVLLTGEVGTGKTTICRSLLNRIPPTIDLAFILNPKITETELLETICDELQIERNHRASKKILVDRINHHLLETNARGRKTVLIIDEAQNLSVDVLEQLRLLTNLETEKRKLLQIILLGQPELRDMINRPQLRQLAQRITARYHLDPLEKEDITGYICHRLEVAGSTDMLFTRRAIKQVHKQSGGIPRLINLICDRALLGAYTRQKRHIDAGTVRLAAREVFDRESRVSQYLWPAAGLVAFAIAALTGYSIFAPTDRIVEPQNIMQGHAEAVPEATEPAKTEVKERPPAEPELSTTWPAGFGFATSSEDSFAELAALWGLSYTAADGSPCDFAETVNLRCYDRQETIADIRELNRPAILTLYDDQGNPFYALLVHLDGNRALFRTDGQELELDIAALESRWFGEYRILWHPPQSYTQIIYPGTQHEVIGWLAESLATKGLYTDQERGNILEGRLLGALKRFQFSAGLTPDGVLGPKTIIQINRATGSPGPRLYL